MNDGTDPELLRTYAESRSEAAFAELVRRHVDFVYSAALRMVCDSHLAEDVTQGVFVAFAQNAAQLANRRVLSGWLHRTAQNIAAQTVRTIERRRVREQEAAAMNKLLSAQPDTVWEHIAPQLDEALGELNEGDRDALLPRYFERKSAREMAQTLGTSEDAAQKRVSRAVERLREFFAKRGITVGASGIVVVITANAVQAAPIGLAVTISSAALVGVATAGGTSTILKLMTVTKLKLGVVSAVIIAVVFIAVLLRREGNGSTGQNISAGSSTSENASDSAVTRRSGSRASGRFSRSEADTAPAATAKEIVAGKLTQFVRSRRELVNALARRHGVGVSDEVKRFLDAAEAGRYEEMQTIFKSLWKQRNLDPDSHDFDSYWSVILATAGTAEQAHAWPAQKLLDYGNATLESLRPGMVYVGGSDPGFFIPMLLNETGEGERHTILTQNALADPSYLDYVSDIYGDRIATLTQADRQHAFQDYVADYQKRLAHDQQFPDEPKQVFPKEEVRNIDGVLKPYGEISVMAVNQILLQNLLQKNPDLSFAMEESFSLPSMYVNGAPLGPLIELRAQDGQNALTVESAGQSLAYWRDLAQQLFSDPETSDGSAVRKAYAHMAEAQANLFANHELNDQAEQAYRIASTLWPDNRQILGRLSELLVREGRLDEANQLLDNFARTHPK